jgi:hypothetical protein
MTDDVARGNVRSQEHYDLAKNLDHSCWQQGAQSCWQKEARRLVRLITGSDLDCVFWRLLNDPLAVPLVLDNDRRMIFAELSSHAQDWRLLQTGQYKLYRGLLEGPHCAVLCRHNVTPEQGKRICTRHDIVSFQPLVWDHGPVIANMQHGNAAWQDFVFAWFEDSLRVRRLIIGTSAGMKVVPPLHVVG